MAYVGKVSIKSNAHMASAIDYIARDEKAMPLKDMKMYLKERLEHLNTIDTSLGERTTLINCSPPDVYKEFEMVRKGFKQDKTDIVFAYFTNNDDKSLYNIAYEKKDESKIKDTLAALNKTMLS